MERYTDRELIAYAPHGPKREAELAARLLAALDALDEAERTAEELYRRIGDIEEELTRWEYLEAEWSVTPAQIEEILHAMDRAGAADAEDLARKLEVPL